MKKGSGRPGIPGGKDPGGVARGARPTRDVRGAPAPRRKIAREDEGWRSLVTAALGIGAPVGFYVWMLSRPNPLAAPLTLHAAPRGMFAGLLLDLGVGLTVGIVAAAALGISPVARDLRARLAVSAAALYLAALAAGAGAGAAALVLAPAGVIAHAAWLTVSRRRVQTHGLILALHAGGLGSALCFFHEWARYGAGWPAFLENLDALLRLLL